MNKLQKILSTGILTLTAAACSKEPLAVRIQMEGAQSYALNANRLHLRESQGYRYGEKRYILFTYTPSEDYFTILGERDIPQISALIQEMDRQILECSFALAERKGDVPIDDFRHHIQFFDVYTK